MKSLPRILSWWITTLTTPASTSVHEAINAGLRNLKKSIFFSLKSSSPRILERPAPRTRKSIIKRVTTKAQKIEAQIPMASVMPKPLTGPVPSQIRIEAVIRVVTLASTMVEVTLSKAPAVAFLMLLPARSSSRRRSKIRMFASTPMPRVSTSAATPGKVKVAPRLASTPSTMMTLTIAEVTATRPPRK